MKEIEQMKWTYSSDGEWSMLSAYHDDGLPFHWRIGICEDGTFCVSGSDPELTRCRETLPTLAEAKIYCESIEQQIIEPGSRCDLELPLDAAAAQARIAELDHELRCERIDGGKVRDDQKAFTAEKNREKLVELVTIQNAIPPACGLARELVERRIEQVKKEIQG